MATEKTRNLTKDRPKRIPLHEQRRDVLTAPVKPGYVRRFFNDKGARIENAKKAGWALVEDNVFVGEGQNNNQTLGSGARRGVGQGVTGILMEIPEELYNEDQIAKQRDVSDKEATMKRNLNSGQGGTYGSVEMESTK